MRNIICIFLVLILGGINCFALESNNLFPYEVKASSYLSQNDFVMKDNYHPYYVVDDNPKTAWVEGVSGDGIGEYIIMYDKFPKDNTIVISIRNGYQKSEELFYKNNRVKDLEIKLTSGTMNKPKLTSLNFTLRDEMGWQQLNIQPLEDCWAITFIIKSVYKGTKYEDTCLSDIKITFENPSLIDAKSQETLKNQYTNWFDERSKKASFFNNLPKDYPFKAYRRTSYQKNINIDSSPLLDMEYFSKVLKNEKLNNFIVSPIGINYRKMLDVENYTKKSICSISSKNKFYTPTVFTENIFLDVGQYVNLANLEIKPNQYKVKPGETIQRVLYVGNTIRAIDWSLLPESGTEYLITRNYYDDKGQLIYVKGQFNGEDGECYNDALFEWDNGKIIRIFWFFAQWGNNGGLDVELAVYE